MHVQAIASRRLTNNGVLAVLDPKSFDGQVHASGLLFDCHGSWELEHGSIV